MPTQPWPLHYIFLHRHPDYTYAEIRDFRPGAPSQTVRQTTLHTDPDAALSEIGRYAAWHHLPIVRTYRLIHDRPFS